MAGVQINTHLRVFAMVGRIGPNPPDYVITCYAGNDNTISVRNVSGSAKAIAPTRRIEPIRPTRMPVERVSALMFLQPRFGLTGFFSTLTHVWIKDTLTNAKMTWRCLQQFISLDVFDSAFEGHFDRRCKPYRDTLGSGTVVGQALRLHRVDWEVILAWVFADDLTLINFITWSDKKFAALSNRKK